MHSQVRVARQHVKVVVVVQNRRLGPDGNGRNETIDYLSYGLALHPATTIQRSSGVVVHGARGQYYGPRQKASDTEQVRFVPRPASSPIRTASQVTTSRDRDASTRLQALDPVFRKNSIQAEVSIRITTCGPNATRQGRLPNLCPEEPEPRPGTKVRQRAFAERG